jgi:hypothetical protein
MTTITTWLGTLLLMLVLPAGSLSGTEGSLASVSREAYFKEGTREFAAGVELAPTDPSAARGRFAKAAAAWRTIVTDGGVRNPDLERNIGNASMLAGDAPRAIAAFRRALSLDPGDSAASAGLAAARRAAGTEAYAPGAPSTLSTGDPVGGWRGALRSVSRVAGGVLDGALAVVPPPWWLWTAATLHVGGWTLAIARARGVGRVRRWMPIAVLAAAVVAAAPLIATDVRRWRSPEAVVVAAGVTARQGPAEMYDPSFKETLTPGLEVTIGEERGEWSMIRLHDGRYAWVRSASLERL